MNLTPAADYIEPVRLAKDEQLDNTVRNIINALISLLPY